MTEDGEYKGIERRATSMVEQLKIFHALLGIFGFLIVQTAGIAWWAATIQQRVEGNTQAIKESTSDRYRGTQALSDFALRDERIENLNRVVQSEVSQIGKSIARIEKNMEKLSANLG